MGKIVRERKFVFLKVITEEIYCYEEGYINGWDNETVIKDWFLNADCPLSTFHATRDTHVISKRLISAETALEKEVEKHYRELGKDWESRLTKKVVSCMDKIDFVEKLSEKYLKE